MDIQQQLWSHKSPFRSKLDIHHGFDQGRTNQSKEETLTPHIPTKKRPSFLSSPSDQKASEAALIPSRNLAQTQSDNVSAAPRNVPQQAPSTYNVLIPTSPSTPLSRSNQVKYLLNPTAISADGRQHDGNGPDSRWTVPIAAALRPATTSLTAMRKPPSRDISLPSITSVLRDQASVLTGLGSPLPSETMKAPSMLRTAHPPLVLPPRPSPCMQTQFVQTEHPASRNSSPPSALPQLASTSEPQSHLPAPFTSISPASTLPQLASGKESFKVTTSKASCQSQYQLFMFETEQGPIQAPVEVQTASKVADKKRKRNAEASIRFRKRRRESEQKSKTQLQEMTEEKEYYRQEWDFLQSVVQQYCIPRPLLPRRRRHALLSGPQIPDTKTSAQTGDRNTLRCTSPYQAQGQPPHTVAAHVPFQQDDIGASTKDQQQVLFHHNPKPFCATAPQ